MKESQSKDVIPGVLDTEKRRNRDIAATLLGGISEDSGIDVLGLGGIMRALSMYEWGDHRS